MPERQGKYFNATKNKIICNINLTIHWAYNFNRKDIYIYIYIYIYYTQRHPYTHDNPEHLRLYFENNRTVEHYIRYISLYQELKLR